jgi:hypothetical protein
MFNCRRQRKPQAATGADTTGEVVYFLRGGDAIKIGYTTNLAARQRTLETGSGDRREETRLHQEWWHLHIRGEWFRADEELLRYIRELAAGPLVVELSPAEREQEARFRRVLAAMDPADLPVIGMG